MVQAKLSTPPTKELQKLVNTDFKKRNNAQFDNMKQNAPSKPKNGQEDEQNEHNSADKYGYKFEEKLKKLKEKYIAVKS